MDNIRDKAELCRHRYYLRIEFTIDCHNIFSEEEEEILIQYGEWMKALVEGTISPITPAQIHFVDVFKNNLAPETQYEKIYKKYLSRKSWETKYGDTSDTPQKIIPRHWEGLTISSDERFKTYQL